ncbi:MAG: hypothetical protein IKH57_20550 [Clostridia bacterium]|nr:hypothetical protein [Clostridia bacterium]
MSQQSRQEYEQRMEWEREEKRQRFSLIYKMLDFVGVVLGVICIFVLLALLFSLLSWLSDDISSTFSILRTRLQ